MRGDAHPDRRRRTSAVRSPGVRPLAEHRAPRARADRTPGVGATGAPRTRATATLVAVLLLLLTACDTTPEPTGGLLDPAMLPAGFALDPSEPATMFGPGCDDTEEMFDRWSYRFERVDARSPGEPAAGSFHHLRGDGIPRVRELIDLLIRRVASSGCAPWEVIDDRGTEGLDSRWLAHRNAQGSSPVAVLVVTDDHTLHYLMRDHDGSVESARQDLEVVLAELLP